MPEGITGRCCWPECGRQQHYEDSPPMCLAHLVKVAVYMKDQIAELRDAGKPKPTHPHRSANGVVYYVRIRGYVKIGVTANLRHRMLNLRADQQQILAVEPGGRDLERQRHREFAEERHGRREDFDLSDRLKHHIAIVRMTHGEPLEVRNST